MKTRTFFLAVLAASLLVTTCNKPDYWPEAALDDVAPSNLDSTQRSTDLVFALQRQMSRVFNALLPLTELASDNYVNTQPYYSTVADRLNFAADDEHIYALFLELSKLREMAHLGLNVVGPNDPLHTHEERAWYFFYEGMAHLLMAENFRVGTAEPNGLVVGSRQLFVLAEEAFRFGYQWSEDVNLDNACFLGRARAQYNQGEKEGATAAALEVLSSDPLFLLQTKFYPEEGLENEMQNAIFDRTMFDDFQPLPSLDFLDPKYQTQANGGDSPVSILKIEEVLLILAEAALAGNDLEAAKSYLLDLILMVRRERPKSIFSDTGENRSQVAPLSRPYRSEVRVAGEANSPFRNDLVLYRASGFVEVPAVSGTSITPPTIMELATIDRALEVLYLLRQEIFMAEGRRMSDMGIKFGLPLKEMQQNPNADVNDLEHQIPDFILNVRNELDDFQYDPVNRLVIIAEDFNERLVDFKTNQHVLPFH